MKNDQTIFYDIDTQRDFIEPDGKFHVAGAEAIVPKLKVLTDMAHEQKVRIVCSVDCHVPGDPMLKSWGGPYPDHCLAGTPGQQKIPESAPLNPLYLKNKEYAPNEIQQVLDHKGEIIFLRQQFESLANNAHLRAILRLVLRPYQDIVIYGVYLEVCADREITALVGIEPKSFFEKWQQAGVELITFDELKLLILN